jgi:hypothetical protein
MERRGVRRIAALGWMGLLALMVCGSAACGGPVEDLNGPNDTPVPIPSGVATFAPTPTFGLISGVFSSGAAAAG